MAKKAHTPKTKKPQEGAEKPIPQEAWDNFDELMDKAVGKKGKAKEGESKKAV